MINPISALHYANPKTLDKIVGFKVATFYNKDKNFTCFWEELPNKEIGKIKNLKTLKIEKSCLEEIAKLQEER